MVAPKTNPGTGGNTGLIKSQLTLNLASFTPAGRSCYRRSDDSPEKSDHFNCLIIFFAFAIFPRSTYLLVSLVNFLVPPELFGTRVPCSSSPV